MLITGRLPTWDERQPDGYDALSFRWYHYLPQTAFDKHLVETVI